MSDSVLDLIDNVIGRHGDAMRWSPAEPPAVDPAHVVDWFAAFNLHLTEWQRQLIPAFYRVNAAVQALVPHIGATTEAAARFMDEYEQVRRRRRSAMHSAYRRRHR